MNTKQQWLVVLGVVALMASGALAASRLLEDELTSVGVGADAPRFTAKTMDDAPRVKSLDDYEGEVLLLNIWATWCTPCRAEMPSIEAVFTDLKPKGLKVVAVSVDQPGMEQQIRDFVRDFKLSFEILYDESGGIQTLYRSAGVPETYVIGRDGVIRKKWVGAEDWNSAANRALLEQLLAEPKS
jgi:cytochrome c biogenesis protein CcmG/thiol:disulfide interchange protein DsbE